MKKINKKRISLAPRRKETNTREEITENMTDRAALIGFAHTGAV